MALLSLAFISIVSNIFCTSLGALPQKIVGGTDALEGEFPYQVSLRQNGKHFCGGAIIDKIYILTAAHCVLDIMKPPYEDIIVVTGTNHLSNGGEIHRISQATFHPEFTPGELYSWWSDIAVLKLTKPIVFNEKLKAVKLPSANIKKESIGIVSGWGLQISNSKIMPDNLQKIYTTVNLAPTCQKFHSINLYEEQLCGTQKSGIGTCMGDSGGPLVINGEVAGIVSFNEPANICAIGIPDIYTNVFEYLSFIKEATK